MTGDADPTTIDGRRAEPAEGPTVVERPGAEGTAPPPSTQAGAMRTAEATLILAREEAARTVALMRLVAPIAFVALVALVIPGPRIPFRPVAAAAFATTLVFTLALLVRFRKLERFDARWALAHALVCVAAVLAATIYVGIFSPTIMAACVGIYFFGLSDSKLASWLIFSTLTGGYAILVLLAVSGLLPLERAVVAIEHPDRVALVTLAISAEILMLLTFWMAKRSRRATRDAFERLERAGLHIRQRDALLAEARADLDLARAAKVGRYTDRRVGDYQVGEIIGRGAMGEVYSARHAQTGRNAALKLLHPAVLGDPEMLERFFREAKHAINLKSPHIVEVFGLGRADDGSPFIAMELLIGEDLAGLLRRAKRIPIAEVVELIQQVGQALVVADEAGIVHRDIKPQNLFLTDGAPRRWKVLDFGVSKAREATSALTQGAVIGTPSYMSPEQARGQDVDHRSDVFSLGVIAYRCLTGRPAFTGADSAITIYNVAHVQPPRPSGIVALPLDVERVLALCLAKDRERRFASATLFAAVLADAARDRLDSRMREAADAHLAAEPWGAELNIRR